MRRILSLLTRPKARAPLFILITVILYFYVSRPVEAVQDVVIQGDYAYLAAGGDGIRILDIRSQPELQEVAHYDLGAYAHSAAIYNNYVYVAAGRDGLRVLDAGSLDNIQEVGRLAARGSVERVVISGSYAFLQDSRSGVRVISLQQPYRPQDIYIVPTRSQVTALAIQGSTLVTANVNRGLNVYDVSNPAFPQDRGEVSLPATALDLATDGRYIFAATGSQGILVLDAADPAGIQQIGEFSTGGPALGIDRYAGFGFVSMGDRGVQVFDLSNPRAVRSVGSYTDISPVRNTYAAYQRVYLAAGINGMQSIHFDVSMDPVEVGNTGTPPVVLDVEVQGNLAFLASGEAGLRVLNVTDPRLPFQEDEFDTLGYAAHILVSGDLAFIADQTGGVAAIDISNTAAGLQPVSVMPTSFQANSLAKSGNLIYVADGSGGLRILNYSNPYAPEEISRVVTGGTALDVAVTSDYAYVADGITGLRVIYTGNPANPMVVSTVDTPGDARSVFISEGVGALGRVAYAFIADGSRGMRIINVSDPRSPVTVSTLEITGFAQDVLVFGEMAYLAMGDKGVAMVNIADPAQPVYLGHYETPGEAASLLVQDNLVYVADNSRGLMILQNGPDPSFMGRLGTFDAPHIVLASYAENAYAYVTDGTLGLWTLDIGQPQRIRALNFEALPGQPARLLMTDLNVLMVGAGDAGVHFLDMSSPTRPLHTGSLDTPGTVQGMAARGFQGYLADGLAGMHIIDFLDPGQPRLLASLNTDGYAFDIALSGEYAFVADGPGGLLAIRVRELSSPAKVSVLMGLRDARAIEIVGSYAYVAAGEEGLSVINIEHPLTMEEVARLPLEGRAMDIQISGSYAFIASDTRGLIIYDIADPFNPFVVGTATGDMAAASVAILNQTRQTGQPRAFQALISAELGGLRIFEINEQMTLAKAGHYNTPGAASLEQILKYFLLRIEGQPDDTAPKVERTFLQVALDMGVFGVASFFIWLFAIGQFVLPISGSHELAQMRRRLVLYLSGGHGPAVRVREGKLIQSTEDQRRQGPGVALVDLSSALVIEPPVMSGGPATSPTAPKPGRKLRLSKPRKTERAASPAKFVKGPGIVFTEGHKRVHSVVDLRPQIRLQTNISAYTRDSIELLNNVFCVFTLGEPAEICQVVYSGEPKAENVRIVRLKERDCPPKRAGGSPEKLKVVDKLLDELDDLDKAEVHRYIQNQAVHSLPGEDATDPRALRSAAPFLCDPERVFAAVYSKALDASTGDTVSWDDLPARVAVDVYRDILSRVTYDALYEDEAQPGEFPLPQLKFKFTRQMKNMGVLSFQYVRRIDFRAMGEKDEILASDLVYYPVQKFQTPKVLRVRGIKVISAGFTELRPMHDDVRSQQLEKWSAAWEAEALSQRADYEQQAMQIRNAARVHAQRNMALTLTELFQGNQFSEEALAIRVFQALNAAAADPVTRKLLPPEILSTLGNLQYWLAPENQTFMMPRLGQNGEDVIDRSGDQGESPAEQRDPKS